VNSNFTAESICVPATWSKPRPNGALVGAALYSLVAGVGVAKHSQKRFTMTATDIDGWPLGPRDGTSG
jgi:hypothetical protein